MIFFLYFILLSFVKTLEDTIISVHHQLFKISILCKSTTLQSLDETASNTVFQQAEQHMLGDLQSLCVQSTEEPDGFVAAVEEWFTVEDSEIV